MDNTKVILTSNLHKACFLATGVHVAVITTFSFDTATVSTRHHDPKTPLNIIFAKKKIPMVLDSTVAKTADVVKPIAQPANKKANSNYKQKLEKQTQSIVLGIRPNSIRAFTDNDATVDGGGVSDSLRNFEKSFQAPLETKTPKTGRYLAETGGGKIVARTQLFGRNVCISFEAEADFGVTNIYSNIPDPNCDNDVDFVFEMKR